jgi:hypothetical protein
LKKRMLTSVASRCAATYRHGVTMAPNASTASPCPYRSYCALPIGKVRSHACGSSPGPLPRG